MRRVCFLTVHLALGFLPSNETSGDERNGATTRVSQRERKVRDGAAGGRMRVSFTRAGQMQAAFKLKIVDGNATSEEANVFG